MAGGQRKSSGKGCTPLSALSCATPDRSPDFPVPCPLNAVIMVVAGIRDLAMQGIFTLKDTLF